MIDTQGKKGLKGLIGPKGSSTSLKGKPINLIFKGRKGEPGENGYRGRPGQPGYQGAAGENVSGIHSHKNIASIWFH